MRQGSFSHLGLLTEPITNVPGSETFHIPAFQHYECTQIPVSFWKLDVCVEEVSDPKLSIVSVTVFENAYKQAVFDLDEESDSKYKRFNTPYLKEDSSIKTRESNTKMLYDSIVIGGGPAGLSTALGLGRQARSCLVISHQKFRNDGIEASHAVLGHDHIHPQKIWARGREQIERYQNTSYAHAEITKVNLQTHPQRIGCKEFAIVSKDGRSWRGRTLVLATGVKDLLPDLDGYEANWPRNIYQCLFCDGWERRHTQKAILCLSSVGPMEVGVASMAFGLDKSRNADGSARVTILANGKLDRNAIDSALSKKLDALVALGVRIDERKVVKLEDAGSVDKGVYVHLQNDGKDSAERVFFGFIVHKPKTALNASPLLKELGVETEAGMFGDIIKTNGFAQATNVAGVFAVGDCGNTLTHVTTALSSGIGAASGIVHYLDNVDLEHALAEMHSDGNDAVEVELEAGCRN